MLSAGATPPRLSGVAAAPPVLPETIVSSRQAGGRGGVGRWLGEDPAARAGPRADRLGIVADDGGEGHGERPAVVEHAATVAAGCVPADGAVDEREGRLAGDPAAVAVDAVIV